MTGGHVPVLLEPVCTALHPERGGVFADGTLGLAGHTLSILERAAAASVPLRVVGVDRDAVVLAQAEARIAEAGFAAACTLRHASFVALPAILTREGIKALDGVLLDLGVSSVQLDSPERGFSFQNDGPLDMRMDQMSPTTAASIINRWPEPQLANLLWEYGEERRSRKIARAIVERRQREPFARTADLAYIVAGQFPPAERHGRIHPATRTFQALRIAVNQELTSLEEAVAGLLPLLREPKGRTAGGRFAVISFHSLEDRIVKHRFREAVERGGYQLHTKKPVTASEEERTVNPRSRSAKLRVIERIASP